MEALQQTHIVSNGIKLHFVRAGEGEPIILIHGWPEFWYTYHKNIAPLAQTFDVIAYDLRGFGTSDKPPLPTPASYLLDEYVADLLGLLDALAIDKAGLVSHDVGAYVAQAFARTHPTRVSGLFFFNCPYPGIGTRWAEVDHLGEIWYQFLNQQPFLAELLTSSRHACELYISHFLRHWAYRDDIFDEDIGVFVDNFMQEGAMQGGLNWYLSSDAARRTLIRDGAPMLTPIPHPTYVFWGENDPIVKIAWANRLGEYFTNITFVPAKDAGHFVHYETPETANRAITNFFTSLQTT